MATPISDTPILYGKEAEDFLNNLDKPLTKRQKEIIKRRKNHKIVLW